MIKGKILALEIDPLCTNDIKSIEHQNLEECEDRIDNIFVIDSRLNLFKFKIEQKCKVLDQCNLYEFENISQEIET